MAKNRESFHEELCSILKSRNVYYQPPESIKINYPAIVYSMNNIRNNFANNSIYTKQKQYEVIVIGKEADSEILERLMKLPLCQFNRTYQSDNLYHDVFTIFY
jgi:hypothetical protein